jgi:hypothetical protein
MTDSRLDAPPADGLETAFSLPPHIAADPVMVDLHREIITRFRRESSGLPMNTVQTLLLERIAANYVTLKWKELNGEFVRANEQKDYNTFWLMMTQEFNKQLQTNQDALRTKMLTDIIKVVEEVIEDIPDKAIRQQARPRAHRRLGDGHADERRRCTHRDAGWG